MASNLETVKKVYESFARGDLPAVLSLMHDEIEWNEPDSIPYGNQVGPQAIAQNIFGRVIQDVADFTVTPAEFVDGGDTIVSIGRYRGRGAKTGMTIDTPFVHVWRIRDGKLSFFQTYTDTKVWVDALGVGAMGV